MLPQGWDRCTTVFLAFVLLVLSTKTVAFAQVYDLERDRVPMVELNGPMRFQTGDDPSWADPRFDDSGWKLLKPDQPWSASGEPATSGFAWYRFTVRIPASLDRPVLYLPAFAYSLQVFANGKLIGSQGRFPPHQRIESAPYLIFTLPNGNHIAGSVVIAIRAWTTFKGDQIGPAPMRIGAREYMDQKARLTILESYWDSSCFGYLILVYLIGSGVFLLFWLRPGEPEYLWFGAYELANAVFYSFQLIPNFYPSLYIGWQFAFILAIAGKDWFWVLFLQSFVKRPKDWSFRLARASIVAIALTSSLVPVPMLFSGPISADFAAWTLVSMAILNLVLTFGLLYPVYRAAHARIPDAAYLFVAFGLFRTIMVLNLARMASDAVGWAWLPEHLRWVYTLSVWPFPFGLWHLSELATQLAMFGMLGLRFARTRRDEERFKGELETARTVQEVLVLNERPIISGFDIDAVYKPAGQVGGDFFQVLPICDAGALVVIGDVSGKGLPAAMAVSMLVGTVRTLAESTMRPADILARMNHRMLGRSNDGFTTCLVLRIDSDGTVTAANAGHLPPYVDAQELPIGNGLPLGLSAESVYTESSFHLDESQELTLLTDGVAEARTKTGELLGFERTASISILSAEQIAATATAFGQQDDITVLKIRRCPVPEPTGNSLIAVPSTCVDDALAQGLSASG